MINELKTNIISRVKELGLIEKYFRAPEFGNTFGKLDNDDLKYIIAFSEVIYHCSGRQEKNKLHKIVQNWTRQRTETDGYLVLFQQAVTFIKLQTKINDYTKPFYDLTISERTNILGKPEHMRSDIYISPGLRNPFTVLKFVSNRIVNHRQNQQSFFLGTLREDLIKGIFGSELGWRLVGYESWPGNGGKYLAYTQPPITN